MQQPFLHFSLIELFLFLGLYNSSEKDAIDAWTLVLHNFLPRYVRRSVGWSVSRLGRLVGHNLLFFTFLQSSASLLLPKRSSDLKYGPCPPARDWGSRVSGLVSRR